MLSYTADQLARETRLLISEVTLLADAVIGEGAGLRALGLEPDSHFDQTRHPDDLVDLERYDIWAEIGRVERYVRHQEWHRSLPTDIASLAMVVERTFSPIVVSGYEEERANHPEGDFPGAHEDGAGDVALGHFYLGILAELVALASARLKVDRSERLSVAEIAHLLDMREATVVTNAHRRKFPSIEQNHRRYAEAVDVLPWMVENGYRPTDMQGRETGNDTKADAVQDYVIVPVARDGSWFSPATASGGRYTIGAKGSETSYADYFEALAELLKMPTPRWRRPNEHGNRGIVAGVRFDRVRLRDVDCAAADEKCTD